jgi:hypothetical protein
VIARHAQQRSIRKQAQDMLQLWVQLGSAAVHQITGRYNRIRLNFRAGLLQDSLHVGVGISAEESFALWH